MMRSTHVCLVCGRPITWAFAICNACERQYGNSPKSWPEWLAFLWRDEQRMRRQNHRVDRHEVTFTDVTVPIPTDEKDGDSPHDE